MMRVYMVAIALLAVSAARAFGCVIDKPESFVFEIIDPKSGEQAKATALATAFLVDSDRGLFVTAGHTIPDAKNPVAPTLRLRQGDTTYGFKILHAGGEVSRLLNDWVLLVVDPPQSLFPKTGASLIYAPRSHANAFADAFVQPRSGSLSKIDSAQWPEENIVERCNDRHITILDIKNYSHGNSGSPVYSRTACGVLGLTSRFSLPEELLDTERQRLVRAFERFTDDLADKAKAKLNAASNKDWLTAMTLLLKDKVPVQLVPTKCIVDAMTAAAIRSGASGQKVFFDATPGQLANNVVDHVRKLDKIPQSAAIEVGNQIEGNRWNWVDYLFVWHELMNWQDRPNAPATRDLLIFALEIAGRQSNLAHMHYALRLAKGQTQKVGTKLPMSLTNLADQFLLDNATWSPAQTSPAYGLELKAFNDAAALRATATEASARAAVDIMRVVSDDQNLRRRLSPGYLRLIADYAIVASGEEIADNARRGAASSAPQLGWIAEAIKFRSEDDNGAKIPFYPSLGLQIKLAQQAVTGIVDPTNRARIHGVLTSGNDMLLRDSELLTKSISIEEHSKIFRPRTCTVGSCTETRVSPPGLRLNGSPFK